QTSHRRQSHRVIRPAVGVRGAPVDRGWHRGDDDLDARIGLKATPTARGEARNANRGGCESHGRRAGQTEVESRTGVASRKLKGKRGTPDDRILSPCHMRYSPFDFRL